MMARKKPVPVVEVKPARKAYPARAERIAMAEKQIARLEKLNASRRDLIARSEEKLNQRKAALARTEAELQKELDKKERLIQLETDPQGKARRREERAQINELAAAIKASGKSIGEILEALKAQ